MELKDIIYGSCNLAKGIVESDSGNEYVVSVDGDTTDTWCTCPRYIFSRGKFTCKHQLFLLDNLEWKEMVSKKFKNFPCGCMTIDSVMGNGFPQGSTVALFAESGRGKTLLSAQLALSCIKDLQQDVIILETEGNREQDFLELIGKFRPRWELTEKEVKDKLHFYPIIGSFSEKTKAMVELLKMVGFEANIDQSKKGDKYSITFKECKPKLKIGDLEKAGLLIIDSLTEPLKATIGHKSQNLPARSELIARLFYKLITIARDYQICVIINHHASINPLQLFGRDFGKPYGGDEVLYNSKYILAIIDSDMSARAKYGKTARRIMLFKHPYNPVTGDLLPVNLKADYGYCDEE